MDEKIIKELKDHKVIVTGEAKEPNPVQERYSPTSVTLMPTYDCNLRCIYCYAHGGENVGELMDWKVAKASIDFIIQNALENEQEKVILGFHGGGEPLMPKNTYLIKKTIDYFRNQAKKYGLQSRVSSATNGVISPRRLDWITDYFDRLNVSLDGPEDIQNNQRPTEKGKSHKAVERTIQYLEEKNFPYGLRATITEDSVSRMKEIIEYFSSISSNNSFHLEPLFECGRCKTTNAKAPTPEDFLRYAVEAKRFAEGKKIRLYYSGSQLDNISPRFCGAAGTNFFVTPEGNVTSCLEVSRTDDKIADIFIIGEYNGKNFDIYEDRVEALRNRTVQNIPHCKDCFAKHNCSGDCLAKVCEQSGDMMDTSNNNRCSINQGLLLDEMNRRLKYEKE